VAAVALTGYVTPGDQRRVLAAGYQMFVPKPVKYGRVGVGDYTPDRPNRKDLSANSPSRLKDQVTQSTRGSHAARICQRFNT
jgi:hypothetical protein